MLLLKKFGHQDFEFKIRTWDKLSFDFEIKAIAICKQSEGLVILEERR